MRLQQWPHLVLWDPLWHAVLWDNVEWTAKHESSAPRTHTAPNVTKHWHYLRDYRGTTISTDTMGPGRAQGCRYNGAAGEVRGYVSISGLLRTFSVCQQFLTLPLQVGHKEETLFCSKSNNLLVLLTLSVCWWMEPEWWRSWTEGRAGLAGSLCWYHGCPCVSGNAGAGLGLPGHAVWCSAARKGREKQAGVRNLWRVQPPSKQVVFSAQLKQLQMFGLGLHSPSLNG